MNFDFRSKKY